jgi:hypothetical protein
MHKFLIKFKNRRIQMTTIRNAKNKAAIISAMNDENMENTIRRKFNTLGEIIEVVIISGYDKKDHPIYRGYSNRKNEFYLVRVRSLDDSDIMRPSPFDAGLTKEEIYRRINSHRQGIVSSDLAKPVTGQVWEAIYSAKNYTPPLILTRYKRKSSLIIKSKKKFQNSSTGTNSSSGGKRSNDGKMYGIDPNTEQVRIETDWDQWVNLGGSILNQLGDLITSYEAGGTDDVAYNNYNMAPGGAGTKNTKFQTSQYFYNHTWRDAHNQQLQPGTDADGRSVGVPEEDRFFAIGGFQLVPYTIKRFINDPLCPLTDFLVYKKAQSIYAPISPYWSSYMSKQQQQGAMAYLILGDEDPGHTHTSKICGGYFMGYHDDPIVVAHVLAKIWAALPCQFNDTNQKGINLSPGDSYYEGYGNNHSAPDLRSPAGRRRVVTAVKNAKKRFQSGITDSDFYLLNPKTSRKTP